MEYKLTDLRECYCCKDREQEYLQKSCTSCFKELTKNDENVQMKHEMWHKLYYWHDRCYSLWLIGYRYHVANNRWYRRVRDANNQIIYEYIYN